MSAHVEDLDAMAARGCGMPDCTHRHDGTVWLHGRCHLNAKIKIRFNPMTREILVVCAQCYHPIIKIQAAVPSITACNSEQIIESSCHPHRRPGSLLQVEDQLPQSRLRDMQGGCGQDRRRQIRFY